MHPRSDEDAIAKQGEHKVETPLRKFVRWKPAHSYGRGDYRALHIKAQESHCQNLKKKKEARHKYASLARRYGPRTMASQTLINDALKEASTETKGSRKRH